MRKISTEEAIRIITGYFGESLVSVIRYSALNIESCLGSGSSTALLIVVRSVDYSALQGFRKSYGVIQRKMKTEPLVLTEETIYSSADIFPIEFLAMKDDYQVLYGKDVFATLTIDLKNLRLQCELNLKGKLIVLRQSYLNGVPEESLIAQSMPLFIRTFANIIRLREHTVVTGAGDIIRKAGEYTGVNTQVFLDLYTLLSHGKPDRKKSVELFPRYLQQLTELARVIDSLDV